ncbi:MAG: hypothetical protein WC307_01715 [Candidatus Nanoarchaeia archaeon]|jgi:hypothetical protein
MVEALIVNDDNNLPAYASKVISNTPTLNIVFEKIIQEVFDTYKIK